MELPAEQLLDNINMAQGVVVQNSDGSTQQVPFDQLQQFDPLLYKQYLEGQAQPQAGLQQTQTSTAATGAQIPGIQARSSIEQIEAQGKGLLKGVNDTFKSASNKGGYVDPGTYNAQRKLLSALGTNGDEFDKNFSTYVDPQKRIEYDTTEGQGLKQKKTSLINNVMPQAQKLIDEYNSLQYKGPAFSALATNKLAPYLNIGGKERNYESQREVFIKSLQDTSKTTDFTGLGISKADIDSMVASIPSITDATDQAENKISNFNDTAQTLTGKLMNNGKKGGDTPKDGGGLLNFLMGGAMNTAQDVGTGIRNIMEQPNLQKQGEQAKVIEDRAYSTLDPKLKSILLGEANQRRAGISQEAGDIGKSFSKDVNENPYLRAITGAGQIAGAAELPFLAKNVLTKTPDVLGNILKVGKAPAEGINTLMKYLTTTEGKTVNKMAEAVNKGDNLNWGTIISNARQEIANKGVPAKKALEHLINQETPAKLGDAKLSASEGWELRKGLGARMPANFFEKALQKASTGAHVPNNQAIEALRTAVSKELKRAAPDIVEPDKMFTFIKRAKGDVPTWGKRVGGALLMNEINKKLNLPQPVEGAMTAIAGAVGGML